MLKDFLVNRKPQILYLFFGAGTTLCNIAVYYLSFRVLAIPNVPSTVIAWVFAVLFAYLTNRKWVFSSSAKGLFQILREAAFFFLCRFLTGVLDVGIMFLAVDVYRLQPLFWKILSNVIVILLNYIAGKALVFKKR